MQSTLITIAALTLATAPQEKKMTMHLFHTVELQGGSAWQKDLPPQKQDLAPHFANVEEAFKKGELLANGPLAETMHGFYVYDVADTGLLAERFKADHGIKNHVLELVELQPWAVLIDNSGMDLKGRSLFVLSYSAGAAYQKGKPIDQQTPALIKAHLDYIGGKAASGAVYLGGPVDAAAGRGRYIVAAASKDEALRFVSEDPGVKQKLFIADVKTWQPFQHQPSRPH